MLFGQARGSHSNGQSPDGMKMSVLEQYAHVLTGNLIGAGRSRALGGVTWNGRCHLVLSFVK